MISSGCAPHRLTVRSADGSMRHRWLHTIDGDMQMKLSTPGRLSAIVLASVAGVTACGGGDDAVPPEETRAQDARNSFAPSEANAAATTFSAQAAATGGG